MRLSRSFSLPFAAILAALPLVSAELKAPQKQAAAGEQSEFLSAPRIGWVAMADSTELRAFLGLPGAARLSDPIVLPAGITRVFVAPTQDFALAFAEESASWSVLSLRDDSFLASVGLAGLRSAADRVAFAPGSSAAVVYDATRQSATVIVGLKATPQVSWTARVGVATKMALDTSGALLLAAGEDGSVSLYRNGVSAVRVLDSTETSGIAFQADSDTAVIADAAQRQVVLIEHLASGPESRIAAAGPQLGLPGSLAWSADGRAIWSADREANAIARIDLAGGTVTRTDTDLPVEDFQTLPGSDHFLIATPGVGKSAWMLTTAGGRTATYFVAGIPAVTPTAVEERNNEKN